MSEAPRRAEVIRLLERYLVEVVERHDLCPWARLARERKELAVEVVWGTPDLAQWVAAGEAALARAGTQVAMVIAPELAANPVELRAIRDQVASQIPHAGIAEFHPAAPLDLASPARLVPFVRRSPDPMLQLVPLSILDVVRAAPPSAGRAQQAQILGGLAAPPRVDAADRIAAVNHATVSASRDAIVQTLDDIAEDRQRSYARVGITGSAWPSARACRTRTT